MRDLHRVIIVIFVGQDLPWVVVAVGSWLPAVEVRRRDPFDAPLSTNYLHRYSRRVGRRKAIAAEKSSRARIYAVPQISISISVYGEIVEHLF